MFAAPPDIETRICARLPDALRRIGQRSSWADMMAHGRLLDSFLEGPSFDRDGNLYLVDIPFGRIFRMSPEGEFEVVAEYDGEPNGLKLHRDGRIFVADHKHGILILDPASGETAVAIDRPRHERFKGCNDLFFTADGDLYFTDQGQTGLQDPTGRLYRQTAAGRLECVLDRVPSPNGLVTNLDETILYLAATRANAVWRVPLLADGTASKVGVFVQLSGGLAGPDGLALDMDGNLAVAHAGLGTVWLFSPLGEPVARVRSCAGAMTTNIAYGGIDRKTLFITESETGTILTAEMPVPGRPMFG
ncbi:MAG: SMP-30/gluconolactonase/LRE family protein [Defluviicoccus sp.]|nr:SMP-30/gluconolactonase/LRE family protein [Defluviicoccus sp.]